MSATAKTLGSLVIGLVGLLAFVSIFIGLVFKVAAFGYVIYLGLALTAVMMVTVVVLSTAGDDAS